MAVDDLRKHNSLNLKFRDNIVMCTTRLVGLDVVELQS